MRHPYHQCLTVHVKATIGMEMGARLWLGRAFLHSWPCRRNSPGNALHRSPRRATRKNPGLGPKGPMASSLTATAPLFNAPLRCLQGQPLFLKLLVTTHLNSVALLISPGWPSSPDLCRHQREGRTQADQCHVWKVAHQGAPSLTTLLPLQLGRERLAPLLTVVSTKHDPRAQRYACLWQGLAGWILDF